MSNKIFLSSDHGGFDLKELVKLFLFKNNFQVEDLGCFSLDAVDYPDYAKLLSKELKKKQRCQRYLILWYWYRYFYGSQQI